MVTPVIPKAQSAIADNGLRGKDRVEVVPTGEWLDFFRDLLGRVNDDEALAAEIAAIILRLETLEGAEIIGTQSVQVFGSLSAGLVNLLLRGDEPTPSPLFYYGTDPVGNKGWQPAASLVEYMVDENGDYLVDENGNFLISQDITADLFAIVDTDTPGLLMHTGVGAWETLAQGSGITLDTGEPGASISFDADTGEVAFLPGATYQTVQKFVDVMHSPGTITGGTITDLGSGNIRVLAGTCMLRIADDDVSTLLFANFAQTDFVVPADQDTRFFGVVYNAGSPIVEMRTVFDWDKDTEIPLGSVVRFNGTTIVLSNAFKTGDPITNVIQRFDAVGPSQRDNSIGGLILGETGTRNITVTAGRIWARLTDFDVTAKNSSVDTMISGFFNGTGLTLTTGLTQWDNLQYNDTGAGTLVTMSNNKYANLWFFMATEGNQYGFIYGTDEYNTLAEASTEGVPFFLTENFFAQTLLLGRVLFQKSAATASIIESAFTRVFTTQAVSTHNDLSGLQGGTTDEFYHLTAAEYAALQAGYQPLDATLTALAGQNWAANALPIGSGADTVSQVAFAANTFPARASTGNLAAKAITDFGLSLMDDATAASARATLGLASGTYTPTLTNVTNVAASSNPEGHWIQVGDVVTVGGRFQMDPTAASVLTELGISLPVPSNFTNAGDLGGSAASGGVAGQSGQINADTVNDRAQFIITPPDAGNRTYGFTFTYQVI